MTHPTPNATQTTERLVEEILKAEDKLKSHSEWLGSGSTDEHFRKMRREILFQSLTTLAAEVRAEVVAEIRQSITALNERNDILHEDLENILNHILTSTDANNTEV